MPASLVLSAIYGSTFMAAAALGSFGLAAATFAINFAVSMIVTRVFSSGNANQNTDNGVRQQVPPATTNSIPIVYGDAYLGGIFVDAVLSTDQKTMYYVMAVSQISPNGQFSFDYSTNHTTSKMYWQDQTVAFDPVDLTKVASLKDGAGNLQTKIAGNLYIHLYTSTEAGVITPLNGTQLPSSVMGGSDIDVAQRWIASGRQMNGLAFAIIKMIYNRDAGTTQMQPVTFKTSHYLNSTGVAKPGDVWYDYITNTKYGCSMSPSIVDAATATALNTYSDQTITYTPSGGGSATQPRYRINGVLDTGQDVLSNLDQIMLACDSWNQYNAATGKWAVVINKAESASFSFDDSNIIGEIRVSAFDIASSINQIQAQFPSKLNRDQSDYVYLNTPANLLFANEPVNKYTINLSLVNDSVQAQYLANRMLEQAREDLIVTFATTYNGIQVDAGDVISVTNSAYGWTNKLFRVIKVSEASLPDGNLGASLELNEYNSQVYDDVSITAYSPAPNSNLSNPNFFSALAAPTVSNINTTATIPHFDVLCVIPATGRVTEVTLFYTTVTSPTTSDWKVWGAQTASNSQPFVPSATLAFDNLNLPTDTYYFAFKVANESGASVLSAISTAFSWAPNPTTSAVAGTFLATYSPIVMQVPRNSSLVPSFTGLITQLYGSAAGGAIEFVASQTDSDAAFVNNTWRIGGSATTGNADITTTGGLTLPAPTDGGTYAQWGIPTAMTSSPATLTVPVRYKSSLGTVTQAATAILQYVFSDQGATGTPGTNGNQSADVALYQWSTTTPSNPNGQSTYTWATATNSAYTGTNGWQTSIPANPGTAGLQLWTAIKPTVVTVGTATTTVDWSAGFTVSSLTTNGANGSNGTNGTNGANGLQTARPTVYQWAITIPAGPVGTSVYTWASDSFTPDPASWSQTITTAPSAGYTLWAATVNISDTATATTTSINWGLAGIVASGYAGTNGANGATGANGVRTAVLEVYRWSATVPTTFPAGTSTYTWATGAFTAPETPNSWTLLPGSSSAGFTLYGCQVIITDSLTTATSVATWNTTTAYAVGAAGANGANGANGTNGTNGSNGIDGLSSRICYAKSTSSSLNSTPATYVTTGVGAFPPTNTWGGAETWQSTPPAIVAGEALFQSDGIFNPATTQTTWNVPYLSNLKVGSLSAISANLGTITAGSISGADLTVSGTGYVRSGQTDYNTGVGFWMGQISGVPKFSIGDPNGNYLAWDGTNLIIKTSGNNLTITGVQNGGSFSDEGVGSSPTNTVAEVRFLANGTVTGYNSGALGNWYNPTSVAIGNSYWIRFTQLTFPDPNLNYYGAALNAWNAMSSTVTIGVDSTITGYHTATFFYQISSASDGSSIVASGNVVVSVLLDV